MPDGIDSSISPTCIFFNQLQHPGTFETLEYFGCVVPLSVLSNMQSVTEKFSHLEG